MNIKLSSVYNRSNRSGSSGDEVFMGSKDDKKRKKKTLVTKKSKNGKRKGTGSTVSWGPKTKDREKSGKKVKV